MLKKLWTDGLNYPRVHILEFLTTLSTGYEQYVISNLIEYVVLFHSLFSRVLDRCSELV